MKTTLKQLSFSAAIAAALLTGTAANALTLPSMVCVEATNPGTAHGNPSYLDVVLFGGTSLDGVRDGWCLDGEIGINAITYTALVHASTSPSGLALVSAPGNVDLATWVLNQNFPGLPALAGGNFTYGDVQRAIWSLIDSTSQTAGLGDWSQGRVDEILALALANGDGFVPGCGQQAAVFLQPVASVCDFDISDTATLAQPVMVGVPADCAPPPDPIVSSLGDKVWIDIDLDGVQSPLDQPFPGVTVELRSCAGVVLATKVTDANGNYLFPNLNPGTYAIRVVAPANYAFVAPNQGADNVDSDVDANTGITTCITLPGNVTDLTWDAGLYNANPTGGGGGGGGTGTIGYWKNHPEAWPVASIVVGGVTYTRDYALSTMWVDSGPDKRDDMFRQLAAAKLNVLIGNTSSCIDTAIAAADAWWATYRSSVVKAKSAAWQQAGGGALMTKLDDYNNGRLCAPHRD